jgi:hypothetical protein
MSTNLGATTATRLKKSDNLAGRVERDYRSGMKAVLALATVFTMTLPAAAATCVLEVDGETYINGPCDFRPIGGADFQIMAGDYFAYVYPSSPPVVGYWNGVEKGSHAHDPLGELKRKGACWVNKSAKVCAYAD